MEGRLPSALAQAAPSAFQVDLCAKAVNSDRNAVGETTATITDQQQRRAREQLHAGKNSNEQERDVVSERLSQWLTICFEQ